LADRQDTGWPPPDPLDDHPWTHILSDKPVAWWSKVQWKLEKVDCSLAKMSKDTAGPDGQPRSAAWLANCIANAK
jgi:hypothetical protein